MNFIGLHKDLITAYFYQFITSFPFWKNQNMQYIKTNFQLKVKNPLNNLLNTICSSKMKLMYQFTSHNYFDAIFKNN
jgi:hypothetical protein